MTRQLFAFCNVIHRRSEQLSFFFFFLVLSRAYIYSNGVEQKANRNAAFLFQHQKRFTIFILNGVALNIEKHYTHYV